MALEGKFNCLLSVLGFRAQVVIFLLLKHPTKHFSNGRIIVGDNDGARHEIEENTRSRSMSIPVTWYEDLKREQALRNRPGPGNVCAILRDLFSSLRLLKFAYHYLVWRERLARDLLLERLETASPSPWPDGFPF
jgi:hypothetical protein